LTEISKILLLLLLILVVTVSSLTNMHALESSEKGAYTDNIRFIQYLDGNIALRDIKAGNLDTYLFRIPLETVASISNDTNVKIYEKNAGYSR